MGVRRAQMLRSVAVVASAVTILSLLPSVQARTKALPTLAEAVGIDVPRPFAPDVRRSETDLDGVTGDLYAAPGPPILIVPGAAPRGTDDPRVVRLARAVARAGRTVFVPDLALAERRFDEADLDRIARAGVALSERPGAGGRVAMLGISYGGSLGLIAAADPRLADRLALVAVFGAYFDLRGVIQAATTGEAVVAGRRIRWDGHPLAATILRQHAAAFAPAEIREEVAGALAGEVDPARLSPAGRAVFDLVTNRDPERTFELASRLPAESRAVLERFSPSTVAGAIDARVVAMHSTDDPAVPYAELVRLERGLPGVTTVTVEAFRHVDFRAARPGAWLGVATDVWGAWRFATWLLEAQE